MGVAVEVVLVVDSVGVEVEVEGIGTSTIISIIKIKTTLFFNVV